MGPQNVSGGALKNFMFAMASDGRMIAIDTAGNLQPVFTGGATEIATGFNNKPTFTGLAVRGEERKVPFVPAEEALGNRPKPKVDRITPEMSMEEYDERKKMLSSTQVSEIEEEPIALPKVERMTSRGKVK